MALIKRNGTLDRSYPSPFNHFIERFFNDGFGDVNQTQSFLPATDLAETAEAFEISLVVPGMKKDDFNIELLEDKLTISGERKFEKESSGKNYHTVQSQYGSFTKSFYLPENVNRDKIEASYVDGILKLVVPKTERKELRTKLKVN